MKVDGALFLNDLATAPDGTVYVSDSNLARIYAGARMASRRSSWRAPIRSSQPNGLLVDGTRLILGTHRSGAGARGRGPRPRRRTAAERAPLRLRSHDEAAHATHDGAVGGIDGIEPDGSGGLLITDVIGARLLHVAASGQTQVLAKFSGGGADFGYIGREANRGRAVSLSRTRVSAYDLTCSLK